MRRVFWIVVGAGAAAVALHQLRKAAEEHPAARMAEKLVDKGIGTASDAAASVGGRLTSAVTGFVDDYRAASAERAEQLQSSLLAETQGTEADLRARRGTHAARGASAAPGGSANRPASDDWRAKVDTRVPADPGDEAELGYEF